MLIDFNALSTTEREKNILMILNHIMVYGETAAVDIAAATGLSVATISRAMGLLKKNGIVKISGKEQTDMGRHPDIFSINPGYGYLLHYYVDAEEVIAYLSDFCGKCIAALKIKINREIRIDDFCKRLRDCADKLALDNGIPYEKVLAAGIAIPGMVDEKNRVVKRIPNFSGFNNENIFKYAEHALGIPVIVNNEARLCAMGELQSDFKDCANLIYMDLTKYSGIGAGIILNRNLYSGKNGFAGEIGDMLVDMHNLYGSSHDDEGCLEAMAGVGIMLDKLKRLLKKGRATILKELLVMANKDTEKITLGMVEQAVLMQDLDVMDVFDETMQMWAIAAVNMSTMLDPDVLILGGVVSEENDVVLARIKHYISKVLYYNVDVRLSRSHYDAQYEGGIYMIKKYVLNNMLTKRLFKAAAI